MSRSKLEGAWHRDSMKLVFAAIGLCGCATLPDGRKVTPAVVEMSFVTRDIAPRYTSPPQVVTGSPASVVERRTPAATPPLAPDVDAQAQAVGALTRGYVLLANHLVVGGETELGYVSSTSRSAATSDGSMFGALGVFAGVTARVRRISASAVVAARWSSFERYSDGPLWYREERTSLESRLQLDVWVCRYASIGVFIGADREGNRSAGIGIALHPLAFDLR